MTADNQATPPVHISAALRPDLNRLLAGEHYDPHFLAHTNIGDHTGIRAYRQHAVEVAAIVGRRKAMIVFKHIEGPLRSSRGRSRIWRTTIGSRELSRRGWQTVSRHCGRAYRFLPTLGEVDLTCLGRGSPRQRLWEGSRCTPRQQFTRPTASSPVCLVRSGGPECHRASA